MYSVNNDSQLATWNHTVDPVAQGLALSASIILPLLAIIGTIASALVGTHVIRSTWKKPLIIDRLILNLFVANGIFISTSFVSLFPAMINIHLGRVPIHSSNTIWCRLQFGWILYIWIVSAYTMLSLSLTRYFVIAKSNQLPSFCKNYPNLCILIFNWIIPLILVLPPVSGFWGSYTYWQVTGLCYPDFTYRHNIYQISYIISYFLLVPILCLCTISISYRLILHETREKRRKIDQHTRENAVRSYIVANVFNTPDEEFIHFSREKHEKLLSKHLVHIFLTCLYAMIPINVILIIHFFCASSASRQMIIIGIILTQTADITNQFCYYFRNRDHFFTVLAAGITKSNKVTCESDIKPSLEN